MSDRAGSAGQEIELRQTERLTAACDPKSLTALFQDRDLTRVPVVRGGKLVGIVARGDLLFGYLKALQHWS